MIMKTRMAILLALGVVVANSDLSARAADTQPAQASGSATLPATAAPQFSGRINEVVSLTQSGVDQSIVLSYIKTSPGPFQPSADEIIKLRDASVPNAVIAAMLQRGGELRDQAVAANAAQNQAYAASTAASTQPVTVRVVTPPATYVDPTYSPTYYAPSTVTYIGGSYGYPSLDYNYGYPYYGSYYSGGYYGPRFSFNFGSPFRIGGGFHGGIGGGGSFHGGGGFHGGGSHGGHR